jgi:hypothetical protein
MEQEGSTTVFTERATGPYLQADEFNPHHRTF